MENAEITITMPNGMVYKVAADNWAIKAIQHLVCYRGESVTLDENTKSILRMSIEEFCNTYENAHPELKRGERKILANIKRVSTELSFFGNVIKLALMSEPDFLKLKYSALGRGALNLVKQMLDENGLHLKMPFSKEQIEEILGTQEV